MLYCGLQCTRIASARCTWVAAQACQAANGGASKRRQRHTSAVALSRRLCCAAVQALDTYFSESVYV